jgi:sulfate transport system permease protein
MLYQSFDAVSAFSIATLFVMLAVVTLIAKSIVEWKVKRERDDMRRM